MRLIDADPIMQRLTHAWDGTPTVENYRDGAPVTLALREIKDLIQNAPTVSPWVKTSDRLPTKADADHKLNVFVWTHSGGHVVNYQSVIESPDFYPWWMMPIPPLPEVRHDNS